MLRVVHGLVNKDQARLMGNVVQKPDVISEEPTGRMCPVKIPEMVTDERVTSVLPAGHNGNL